MTIRRWGRTIRQLHEKGKPGTMARHVVRRRNAAGVLYEFHVTKGYRRPVSK